MPIPRSLGGTKIPWRNRKRWCPRSPDAAGVAAAPGSARQRSVVVLPQPEGPSSVSSAPALNAQIDAVDGADLGIAGGVEELCYRFSMESIFDP